MPKKRLPDEEELSAISLRVPLSLRAQLEQSARRQRRSLNQEVILWLERAAQDFAAPEPPPPAPAESSPGR